LQKEKVDKVKAAKDRLPLGEKEKEKERAVKLEKERSAKAVKELVVPSDEKILPEKKAKLPDTPKFSKRPETTAPSSGTIRQSPKPSPVTVVTEPPPQTPLLSKRPKKSKPGTKPIRIPKEEESNPGTPVSTNPVVETSHNPSSSNKPIQVSETSSNNSRAQSVDYSITHEPTSVEELLEEIDIRNPSMNMSHHPFFDLSKINPTAKMPLEYGPLVHALSALSVGGGSFANNIPSGSIDNAVSSFQQLLETLTQTISDLLRLLPRTTWDDSSSFDGVLRDMLKGDDFLDDGGEDGPCKEDEVAALTLALERRARWMEVQLSKLEELHRDINTAAVRAVLSFNDNGWDRDGFLPRVGDSLRRFDNIGLIEDGGVMRRMSVDELERQLVDAKKAALVAETEVREFMEKMQDIKPAEVEV
jgi:CCR4-NOT transcription complex subunit 4